MDDKVLAELERLHEAVKAKERPGIIPIESFNLAILVDEHLDALLAAARSERRLRDLVKLFANQRLPDESDEDERDGADYEGAYETMVRDARDALAESEVGK